MFAGNPSIWFGALSVVNIFARGVIAEHFEHIDSLTELYPIFKKLIIILPIYYETRDWFLSISIALTFMILIELSKIKSQKNQKDNKMKVI